MKPKIRLYNTLSRKIELFKPINKGRAGLYTCGPTVYNYAHIGNLRTYIFEDVLRRTLKYNGYKVKQVMNITDVEDKIIKRALQKKKNIYAITRPYTKVFFDDLKKLNIEKAEFYPKATENIKEMIELIKTLVKRGFAYQGEDNSVYFDISKFGKYGKLSNLQKREIKTGARVNADEYDKKQAQDFVLWKAKKNNEPSWQSPWGPGRPGWHIECSAMSMKYLGKTFDIHTGGVDLIFPHHENEIAQSEAATGRKFVNFWLEGEHLLVDGQRMAKSLGNFHTLRNMENKKFNPLAFRYLVLTSRYRSKLNFTWKSLAAAENALNGLCQFLRDAGTAGRKIKDGEKSRIYEEKFTAAINNDLDTPKAISLVWKLIKNTDLRAETKKQLLLKFDKVLGFRLNQVKPLKIPKEIKHLAIKREQFRVNKQFVQADRLREKINLLGYIVEDTPRGPIIYPKKWS
jgi:cysteinyl-tRNA synthetase